MKFSLIISALVATSAISLERKGDFYPFEDGFEGHWTYNRSPPEHFDGPGSGDDQFMNSMISKYAMESADK